MSNPAPRPIAFYAVSLCLTTLLLVGCVVPGYPYNGYSATPSGSIPPPQSVVVAPPGYSYVYAPAPVIIAPSCYAGWGNGYWYGNRFWPYRSGCHFYNGRYYGGYRGNHWQGNHGNWNGYRGGYWNR